MRFFFSKRPGRVREEALEWLARLKRGLRQGEGPEFLAWLERRSHRTAIARAAVEWHGPEVLAVLAEIFPIPPAILKEGRGFRPALLTAAAFAGACITLGVPIALLLSAKVHRYEYSTAIAATRRLTLEDGTRVALNHGTQIDVTYAAQARSVFVTRGEALFKVVGMPNRPFYLHAAGRNFEASAAIFDIRFAAPDILSLTVLEGTVTVFPPPRPGRKTILLQPLQMLVIGPNAEFGQTISQEDVRSQLSWQKGT